MATRKATKRTAAKPETPEANAEQRETAAKAMPSRPNPEPDRVAMVSLRADGTPDQSDGFKVIGED